MHIYSTSSKLGRSFAFPDAAGPRRLDRCAGDVDDGAEVHEGGGRRRTTLGPKDAGEKW